MSDIETNDESVIITEKVEVRVELTPERLAEIFWAMSEDQQAQFFNALGGEGASLVSMQQLAICESDALSEDGCGFLESLADAVNGRV